MKQGTTTAGMLQVWNVTLPATVWCDECRRQTDHNGEWHRQQVAYDGIWPAAGSE